MCFSSSWLLGSPAFATCATFQRSILISRSITIWATNKWEIQMSGSSQISHVIVFLLCRNNIRVQKYANSSPLIPQKFSSCCLIKSGESTERWKFLLTNRATAVWDDVTLDKYQLIASEFFEKYKVIVWQIQITFNKQHGGCMGLNDMTCTHPFCSFINSVFSTF